MRRKPEHNAVKAIAQRIAREAYYEWEYYEEAGTGEAAAHLAAALRVLMQCNIPSGCRTFRHWLIRRAYSPIPSQRRAAIRALGFLGENGGDASVLTLLQRRLRSSSWLTKQAVLEALRELPAASVSEALRFQTAQEMKHPRVSVRLAAARLILLWEAMQQTPSTQVFYGDKIKPTHKTQYLLDLARDIAQRESLNENTSEAFLILDAGSESKARLHLRKSEIERLLAQLDSSRRERRQSAARALRVRTEMGVRIFSRSNRIEIFLPSD